MSSLTDHFDGRRFFNPNGANGQPFWRVPRLLLTSRTKWPSQVPVESRRPPNPGPDEVVVTFIGHASFLIQAGATNVLIDPVYYERASPVSFAGPRRVRAPGVRFDDLPPVSLVLLSHNHYDHCDLGTLRLLDRRFHPRVVTPRGNGRLLRSAGIRQVEELDWWEHSSTAPLPIRVTPAQHFSARGPFDRNRALWGGFLIEAGGLRILHAGDSGYGSHFRDIGARLGPIDLALLPIGAYEPRWFMKDIHMNPAEAVQAHLDLAARRSIAMHYGTFQLTPEGIDEPVRELAKELRERGLPAERFRTLEVGESVALSQ
ncbi:MAG TPA: MBL fold metallo-hydrolase [Gemmatimonadales bacterium]|jgi:L-ascorbate metabolism protein UlaG (beta-lactamase superfamily)|nr:MBL fold metallo-hydrolase [Gemmatimonadales bacterium]